MTIETVRAFFASRNLDLPIIELGANTATVGLAAEAHGVEPGRIAKTLAFRLGDDRVVLVVAIWMRPLASMLRCCLRRGL